MTSGGSNSICSSDKAVPKSASSSSSGVTIDGIPRNHLQSAVASIVLGGIDKPTSDQFHMLVVITKERRRARRMPNLTAYALKEVRATRAAKTENPNFIFERILLYNRGWGEREKQRISDRRVAMRIKTQDIAYLRTRSIKECFKVWISKL